MENIFVTIQEVAENKINFITENHCVKSGINGPYNCKDTSVRNNSHWINIFRYLWEMTKNIKYYDALVVLADNVIEEKYRGISGAICCMLDDNMDHLNGTIGQGWAIEGLIAGFEVTKSEKYLKRAIEIFLSQQYNYERHIWHRVELDGTNIGPDRVFNHQLWFAATSAKLITQLSQHKSLNNA